MGESLHRVWKERDIVRADMQEVCAEVVAQVRRQQRAGAAVLALSGPLGAGKTTFSQECAQLLGVQVPMQSPTFVIEKRYTTTDQDFPLLVHIDAYRIEDIREMNALRFQETLTQTHTMLLLEWPEHIAPLIPEDAVWIYLSHTEEETKRHIRYCAS